MLPPKGRTVLVPHDDTSPDVPRIIIPQDSTQPPIWVPAPPRVPTVPPSSGFVIHDIRGLMPFEAVNFIGRAPKSSLTIHWEGASPIPPMSVDGHVIYLQAIANAHIRRNWSSSGTVHGDGIMYHECIAQNGDILLMREDGDIVYHANNQNANVNSRAILVLCSEQTPPTERQLDSLRQRVGGIRQDWGTHAAVWPHSHWSATACPGDTIRSTIASL